MNNSHPSESISPEQWNQRLNQVHVSRDELNKLIMNYLVLEGHKEGALTFQRESGIQADDIDMDLIDARVGIKTLIL